MCRRYLYLLATDKKTGFLAGIFKIFLFILSLIYGLVVMILSFFYLIKPYKPNCRIISIGNITLGGTGKTSLVESLAKFLRNRGRRVAVLSRGYKRKVTNYQSPIINYQTMGDEAYMLSKNLVNIPVIVDEDRVRAVKKAIGDYQVDTVILDDGFQQWRIKKDLDIVTIDATNPWGNLRLLPRGILREPLSSLRRAGVFVLTKANLHPDNQRTRDILKSINPDALIVEAIHKPVGFYKLGLPQDTFMSSKELSNKPVSLVSGIADPESFEELIKSLGINIGLVYRFPDHHIYTTQDLNKIKSDLEQNGINIIITTEKDSVRFPAMDGGLLDIMECFVLRIELEISQNEIFNRRIYSLY